MMYKIEFDPTGNPIHPDLYLCRRDLKVITVNNKTGAIPFVSDFKFSPDLEDTHEISFTVYKKLNGATNIYWDEIKDNRIVKIADYGVFEISVSESKDDKGVLTKSIHGLSLECELGQQQLFLEINTEDDNTYSSAPTVFYNPTDTEHSLLHRCLKLTPAWTIGHVDEELWDKQRIFSISGTTAIDFFRGALRDELETLFIFDTFTRTVNVYLLDNYGVDTTAFIDDVNLLQSASLDGNKDDIKNCFKVEGGDEKISIANCNPAGSDYIYLISEEDKADMPTGLVDKINSYEILFVSKIAEYSALMLEIAGYYDQIAYLTSGMIPTDAQKTAKDWTKYGLDWLTDALKGYQKLDDDYAQSGFGLVSSANYLTLYKPNRDIIVAINTEIDVRAAQISAQEDLQLEAESRQYAINAELDREDYFGVEYWNLLSTYIRMDVYQNPNYVSDGLSDKGILELSQELLVVATRELQKASTKQWSISASLNDPLSMKAYESMHDSFQLGNYIRVVVDNEKIKLRIKSMSFDFENPENIDVEFNDLKKLKPDDLDFQSVKSQVSSIATSYNSVKKQASKGAESTDELTSLKNNGLNTSNIQLTNSVDNEVTYGSSGLLCRAYNETTGVYGAKQLRIVKNGIHLTDDGWNTISMSMGEYSFNGNSRIGLCATRGNNTVTIDPVDGFAIYKGLVKQVYINDDGDAEFAGVVKAAKIIGGTVEGTSITGTTISGNTITGGTISGTTITGTTISGNTIDGGSITGTTITGSEITGTTSITGATISGGSINIADNLIANADGISVNQIQLTEVGVYSGNIFLENSDINFSSGYTNGIKFTDQFYNEKYVLQADALGYYCYVGTSSMQTIIRGSSVTLGTSGGATVTSDERVKDNIKSLDDRYETFFNNYDAVTFQYINGNTRRDHAGYSAQNIKSALDIAGISSQEFAGYVENKIDKEYFKEEFGFEPDYDTQLSLRYEEFIPINSFMIKKLQAEVKELRLQIESITS